jgi:hypothetical protein
MTTTSGLSRVVSPGVLYSWSSSTGCAIDTAGLIVLSVVGGCRHTMAWGGSGSANVVFAVARRSGLAFQGSVLTLALLQQVRQRLGSVGDAAQTGGHQHRA